MSTENFKLVQEEVFKRIRVFVAWDGYCSKDKLAEWEMAIEVGITVSAHKVKESLERSMQDAEGQKYEVFYKMREQIIKHESAIEERLRKKTICQFDAIPEEWLKILAIQIEKKNTDDLVLIAPDLWWP